MSTIPNLFVSVAKKKDFFSQALFSEDLLTSKSYTRVTQGVETGKSVSIFCIFSDNQGIPIIIARSYGFPTKSLNSYKQKDVLCFGSW